MIYSIVALISYIAPFYAPSVVWWLIFLCPYFTLRFVLSKPKLSSYMLWSVIVTTLHLIPLCRALIAMAHGAFIWKIALPLFTIVYTALYPFCWLWITSMYIDRKNLVWSLCIWTISTTLYFMS